MRSEADITGDFWVKNSGLQPKYSRIYCENSAGRMHLSLYVKIVAHKTPIVQVLVL